MLWSRVSLVTTPTMSRPEGVEGGVREGRDPVSGSHSLSLLRLLCPDLAFGRRVP